MTSWLDYETGRSEPEQSGSKRYVWPALGGVVPCPSCGRMCKPLEHIQQKRTILLDPETRRVTSHGATALEHRCMKVVTK